MTHVSKCTVTDGIITPCTGFDSVISIDGSRGKGVTLLHIRNLATLEVTRTFAVLRSGTIRKNGIIMNYCPFCGEAIAEHMKAADDA